MKIQKPICFGIALASIFVFAVSAAFLRRPVLEQWYLRKLSSDDERDRKLAAEKLGKLRSVEAIVPLIELFRSEYTLTRYTDARDTGFIRRAEREPLHYSADALIAIGPPAVPALISALELEYHYPAARALATIGAPAVPALIDALEDDSRDEILPLNVSDALSRMGPHAAPSVPHLIELFRRIHSTRKDSSPIDHRVTIDLVRIGPPAVPALRNALRDDDYAVRWMAAVVLGEVGLKARAAVPDLENALTDENDEVRRAVSGALKKIALSR